MKTNKENTKQLLNPVIPPGFLEIFAAHQQLKKQNKKQEKDQAKK